MNAANLTEAKCHELIQQSRKLRFLVIGDLMLDKYVIGKVSRISPEAPVPVVQVTEENMFPGGAANVARNLTSWSAAVSMCGILGRDPNGRKLYRILQEARIGTEGVFVHHRFTTITKTRVMARQQQVVRVDREGPLNLEPVDLELLRSFLNHACAQVDAVIVEDYGKGLLTQEVVNELKQQALRFQKPVIVDPNPNNPVDWSGVTAIKPNRSEAFRMAGEPERDDEASLIRVGQTLMKRWEVPHLLITLGEQGMLLMQPDREPYHTPTRAREVFDVSGAGDTAVAFFTLGLTAGLSGEEAAELANHASGIVVGKLGTATVTHDELLRSVTRDD